ncbi:hypothetical protein [Micromonospora yangpuensis]|uniref:Uncharacterized protein n=1 Tax=Micromonospora yangpuensis TaxID=683228 RepID=A0A1C6VBH5_9ACTN|nr:hypothetical protein [Micromonospora yangpuensis]SCL63679.1 hypothetical protein GA0070617_5268 [Micromonospora yangpuensis]
MLAGGALAGDEPAENPLAGGALAGDLPAGGALVGGAPAGDGPTGSSSAHGGVRDSRGAGGRYADQESGSGRADS